MAEGKKTTAEQVRESLAAVADVLGKRFDTLNPNDPSYPLGVVVLGSPRDDAATAILYQTTATCNAPGHKDGWAQAMVVTRDMLLLCNRMNDDFSLGLTLLPAVLAQHPMMQKYLRPPPDAEAAPEPRPPVPLQPSVSVDPKNCKRTVTDLIESTAGMEGGVGGPTKH